MAACPYSRASTNFCVAPSPKDRSLATSARRIDVVPASRDMFSRGILSGGAGEPVVAINALAPTARCVRICRLFPSSLIAVSFAIIFSTFKVSWKRLAVSLLHFIPTYSPLSLFNCKRKIHWVG